MMSLARFAIVKKKYEAQPSKVNRHFAENTLDYLDITSGYLDITLRKKLFSRSCYLIGLIIPFFKCFSLQEAAFCSLNPFSIFRRPNEFVNIMLSAKPLNVDVMLHNFCLMHGNAGRRAIL